MAITRLGRGNRPAAALALLAVAVASMSMTSAQPSVPLRTHTFGSYQSDPVTKDLLPVFVTTVKSLQGTYAQDEVVSIATGAGLKCNPLENHRTDCKLVQAWRKPRRANDAAFTRVFPDANGNTCEPFAFKLQNNKLRLMVSPVCLSPIYSQFDFNATRRALTWQGGAGRGKNYSAIAQAKWANKNQYLIEPGSGLYYDPWAPVCVCPLLALTGPSPPPSLPRTSLSL